MAAREKKPEEHGADLGLGRAEAVLKKMEERYKYLERKDRRHGKVNYSAMDTRETLGEETIPDLEAKSVEDQALANILCDEVRGCLSRLSDEEREVIQLIYYERMSEREAAKRLSLHNMTVHTRKARALEKLKEMMRK